MVGDRAAAVPEAGARAVGIRDRRGGDAARRRATGDDARRGAAVAHRATRASCCRPRRCIMSVLLIGSAIVDDDADSGGGSAGGRPGRRPRARVSRAPRLRRAVRHALRPGDDRHALVRRRVGDGRPAEPGAAVSAALRHGAGLGARDAAARRCSSRPSASSSRSSFNADVNAQGGAYATGVLVLMTSAAGRGARSRIPQARGSTSCRSRWSSSTRPSSTSSSGRKASRSPAWFIVAIIVASLVSRVMRSTEIRIEGVEYDERARAVRPARPPDGSRCASSRSRPEHGRAGGVRAQARGRASDRITCRDDVGAVPRGAAGRRLGVLGRAAGPGRRRRRLSASCAARARRSRTRSPACCSICATAPTHPARLLRLDRRQSDRRIC